MAQNKKKVSLFITCLCDLFAPDVGVATVDVLRKLGVEVDFPKWQTCCGQPQFNNGVWQDARKLAERMIDVFAKSEYVVTPSGSCAAMVREQYPVLFADDPIMLQKAEQLVAKTYELVEFIVKVLKVDDIGATFNGTLTYHYSCHLRGLGMTGEAETLIRKLHGVNYIPMEQMDQCCGFGGSFAVKHSDVSGAMTSQKCDCIGNTNCDAVVVNDTGCAMNISGMLHRRDDTTPVIHLAQILSGQITEAP